MGKAFDEVIKDIIKGLESLKDYRGMENNDALIERLKKPEN
jgi:hypothetical protein